MHRPCTLLFLIFQGFFCREAFAQASQVEHIAAARKELIVAFQNDDPAGASLWMDSLARLDNNFHTALLWDERWLLYFWLEAYGNVFDEAAHFDETARYLADFKTPPPKDSLFEIVDAALYERQYELFRQMGNNAFLNEEERAFATLQLEYLLRLDPKTDARREKIDAFVARYPNSRFNTYLLSVRPDKKTDSGTAFGMHLLLQRGSWQDNAERYLRPHWGIDINMTLRKKRMNYTGFFGVGGQKIDRDIEEDGYIWPKGESSTLIMFGLEVGYDVFDGDKIRVWPTVGGGVGLLHPPTPGEEDEPLPFYYDSFRFSAFYPQAALNADIKFKIKQYDAAGLASDSYQAVRVRLGYQWLNYGRQNAALEGNMLFFSVGYAFSLRGVTRS